MDFVVRVPTTSSRVTLEAHVKGDNWRDVLGLVLEEVGRDASVLDRAHVHIRRDGRIIVEDPDTLRLFELRPVSERAPEEEPKATPLASRLASPPEGASRQEARPPRARSTPAKPISSEEMRRPPSRLGRQPALKAEASGQQNGNGQNLPAPIGFTAEPIPVVVVDTAQQEEIAPLLEGGLPELEPATQTSIPTTGKEGPSGRPLGRMDETTQNVPSASGKAAPGSVQHGSPAADNFGDLRAGRSVEVVAGTLLRAVRARVPADAGVILVPDGRRRHVLIAAGFGLPQQFKLRRFKYGDGVGGFVCEFDSAIRVDDLASRPDLLGEFESVFKNLKGIVAIPIRSRGETLGAVELLRARGEPFSETDQNLLKEVCDRQARLIG